MNRNRGSRFPIVLLGHDPRITGKNNTPVSHGPCDARIMNQPTSSIVISNFRSSPQRFLSRDTVTRRHFFSTSQRKPTVDNRLRSRATLSIIVPLFLLATDAEELRFRGVKSNIQTTEKDFYRESVSLCLVAFRRCLFVGFHENNKTGYWSGSMVSESFKRLRLRMDVALWRWSFYTYW